MKKRILFFALSGGLIFASCAKDNINSGTPEGGGKNLPDNFTLTVGKSDVTATASAIAQMAPGGEGMIWTESDTQLGTDGKATQWLAADQIGCVSPTANVQFTTKEADIEQTKRVQATFTKASGATMAAGTYVCYYPYISDITQTFAIAEQNQQAGTNTHTGTYDFLYSDPKALTAGTSTADFTLKHFFSLQKLRIGLAPATSGSYVVRRVAYQAHDALGNPVNAFVQSVKYQNGGFVAASLVSQTAVTVANGPVLTTAQDFYVHMMLGADPSVTGYVIDIVVVTDKGTFILKDQTPPPGGFTAGKMYTRTLSIDPSLIKIIFSGPNFRNYLNTSLGLALTADGNDIDVTSTANLALFKSTTTIDCSSRGITSLSGIEYFKALTTLNCSGNTALAALDVSKNTALVTLNCSGNTALTALNITGLTLLQTLNIASTGLTTVSLTTNTALKTLLASNAKLTSLNIAANVNLLSLDCSNNANLATLSLTTNTQLTSLLCKNCKIATLDISKAPNLATLKCVQTVPLTLKMTVAQNVIWLATWLLDLDNVGTVLNGITVSIL